ncbi:MAG: BON domain-containing protein [Mariniblastus sp.]
MKTFKPLISFAVFGFLLVYASHGFAQGGGGNQGGGNQGGGQVPTQPTQDQFQQPTQQADTSGDTSITGGDGVANPAENQVDISVSDNTRNQGFVGSTSASILNPEVGFVGAASNTSGPPLVEDATFGGGVNDGFDAAQFQPTQPTQNQGFNAPQNRVEVIRRSIRAKLRPSFYAPRPNGQQVSTRFNNRFVRQPGSQIVGNGYSVVVENRKAVLTGVVNTAADSDRLVRQLRLEPGVYQIENRLRVVNQ